MSVNSSSSSSHPFNTASSIFLNCFETTAGTFSAITFTVTLLLLVLPLCVYVLYLGFQRWRQQRSGTTMSHSDVVTFHMVVMELVSIVGGILFCCGVLTRLIKVVLVGTCLLSINISGQLLFHSVSCVERYLAVVHPVTYLSLKNAKWIRIRNIFIAFVWLMCFANMSLLFVENKNVMDNLFCLTSAFHFTVMSFCSLSVLYVLIRPGPGAGGEGRPRVDQSKRRAFYTIMAILGALVLRVGGSAIYSIVKTSPHVTESDKCSVLLSVSWFVLPSSLVLPLLFIHRAGQLLCCKNSNQPGQGSD